MPTDGGNSGLDATVSDADVADARAEEDGAAGDDAGANDGGASEADAGSSDDAGGRDASSPDAGDSGPPSTCRDELGMVCDEETPCAAGFVCELGRCAPQDRPVCGGFANAGCMDPRYPSCLYYDRADFGPCLTRAERDCICGRRLDGFVCD